MSASANRKPEITQQMIALYDDYTHLSLDRRKFMDALSKMVGSSTLAVAAAAMMAANAEAASMVAADDARLSAVDIVYPGATGDMKAYHAMPKNASAKLGAVIVVHENRGLNEHIRDVNRRMALEGFVALAPDFLSPLGGTPADEDVARSMFAQLNPQEVWRNGVAAVDFLKNDPRTNGKVGATGFCWGGGTVNQIAVHAPDLLAAAPYYGGQPDAADVGKIRATMLLHYAGLDERVNAGIAGFKAALDKAGTSYELHIYEGANHAFNNDTSEARYDKAVADLAWSRTVGLFKAKLA